MNTNTQSYFDPVFAYIRTTEEAAELVNHIDLLLAKIYMTQKDPFEKIAYALLEPEIAKVIQDIFVKKQLSWSNAEEVKSFLTSLKSALKGFDVLTITLPYQPTSEDITAFSTWVKTNLGTTILLEVHIDQSLIGGAVIVYKGIYVDQTLQKKLDEYFIKHKDEIVSQIRIPKHEIRNNTEIQNDTNTKTILKI